MNLQYLGRAAVLVVATLLTAALIPGSSAAYERYNDGCPSCHGSYLTSPYTSPTGEVYPASLLDLHQLPKYMGSDCNLCHTTGDNDDPYIGSSDGTVNNTGYGCTGCHGNMDGNDAMGYGTRLHHANNGAPICMACHLTDGTPPTEDIPPPYYGTADTNVAFPCNDDVDTSEDFSGNGEGLDNDGDDLYDLFDPDCMTCIDGDGDGYGNPGDATCSGGAEEDCDDADAAINPGAPEATCDGVDNDCDPATEDEPDADGDGFSVCDDDCDDADDAVNPDADEVCDDTVDNDCDGDTDEEDSDCEGDDDSGDDDSGDDDSGDDDASDDDASDDDASDDDSDDTSNCECESHIGGSSLSSRGLPNLLSIAALVGFLALRRRS